MKKLKNVSGEMKEIEDEDHPYVETSAIDFYEEIEKLENVQPRDRRSVEYKKWKRNINEKIEEANSSLGRKIFNTVK